MFLVGLYPHSSAVLWLGWQFCTKTWQGCHVSALLCFYRAPGPFEKPANKCIYVILIWMVPYLAQTNGFQWRSGTENGRVHCSHAVSCIAGQCEKSIICTISDIQENKSGFNFVYFWLRFCQSVMFIERRLLAAGNGRQDCIGYYHYNTTSACAATRMCVRLTYVFCYFKMVNLWKWDCSQQQWV